MEEKQFMKASPALPVVYDSTRRGSAIFEELREIFNYHHLVWQLVRRDILTRYKRSFLGVAWTMLNPLGMMLVWTIAFSQFFKSSSLPSYPSYVLSGLLAWTFFSQTTTAAMVNLIWGGGLLNRIYIPRVSFALAAMGTGLVNLCLSLIPLFIVMLVTGMQIHLSFIFIPVSVLVICAFALGVGLLISTWAVYFPDISEMYQIVLTAWMFLTPIMYPEELLPADYRVYITMLNPMYHMVKLFRIPTYYGRFPTWMEFLIPLVIALVMLIVGWVVFARKSDEFAYRI
jgi:ABC-type polysaccharide/polyol phosphate export permease